MLEGLLQSMSVIRTAVGGLGAVGHDDVRVAVRILTVCCMRVLDHFDQPMKV